MVTLIHSFSNGFSIQHVESVLNKVELDAKEPKKNFGLCLSTVSFWGKLLNIPFAECLTKGRAIRN